MLLNTINLKLRCKCSERMRRFSWSHAHKRNPDYTGQVGAVNMYLKREAFFFFLASYFLNIINNQTRFSSTSLIFTSCSLDLPLPKQLLRVNRLINIYSGLESFHARSGLGLWNRKPLWTMKAPAYTPYMTCTRTFQKF